MTKGHSRGHLSWPQHATTWSQEWRNDVKPCLQSSAKSLLETYIALDWMACYKRIAEIANIFKTGRLHPCMGSNTNWPRVRGWSCTFTMLHLASTRKWIICAGRHCNLTNHDCAQIWLQKPGLRGDPLFKSWDGPIANCTQSSSSSSPDSAWSYDNFQTFQHEMLPFRSVWRLLQTKGPSGSRLNSSTVSMAKIRAGVAGRQFQPECYCYRDRTATCCVWTWNRTGVVRSYPKSAHQLYDRDLDPWT